MLKRRALSVLQRFSVVVTLVLAAVVASILSDGPARLPRIAIPIPPAIEPRIVRAVCSEGRMRVMPLPAFAGAVPAKTDINRACVRDGNDSLHALATPAREPVDSDAV
jgi:hypothetical protein